MTPIDHDISIYTARALAIEADCGSVSPASLVSAEDLDALERAARLTAAIATVCFSALPTSVYRDLVEMTAALTELHTHLDNPEQNWRDA